MIQQSEKNRKFFIHTYEHGTTKSVEIVLRRDNGEQ
jgi:hypothetical protein